MCFSGGKPLVDGIALFVEECWRHGVGAEHFQLFPRDGDVADDTPPQPALGPRASDFDDFGAQRPSGPVWITEQDAAVGFDPNDLANHPSAVVVAPETDRLVEAQPEAGESGRRALHGSDEVRVQPPMTERCNLRMPPNQRSGLFAFNFM